jgi:hypothetical protein
MRKLIITVLIAAALMALVSATAIALLGLPQEELMYAMTLDNPSGHSGSIPLWIPA